MGSACKSRDGVTVSEERAGSAGPREGGDADDLEPGVEGSAVEYPDQD